MDNIFYNSEGMIMEYFDILRAPGVGLLSVCRNIPKFRELFDCTVIDPLSPKELQEWYVNRLHQNPLMDLVREENPDPKIIDKFYYDQFIKKPEFVELSIDLPAINLAIRANHDKVCKKFYIYVPVEILAIDKDIHEMFDGMPHQIIYGDFIESIKYLSKDVMYVLSDIQKANALYAANRMSMSAFLLPSDYRYNKNNIDEYKVDFNDYGDKIVFKHGFFQAYPLTE